MIQGLTDQILAWLITSDSFSVRCLKPVWIIHKVSWNFCMPDLAFWQKYLKLHSWRSIYVSIAEPFGKFLSYLVSSISPFEEYNIELQVVKP